MKPRPPDRRFVRRYWPLILVTVILSCLAGAVTALCVDPTYRAIAVVSIPPGTDVEAGRLMVRDPAVLAQAKVRRSDMHAPYETVVVPIANSPDYGLSVESTDPFEATTFANTWATAFAEAHGQAVVRTADVPQEPITHTPWWLIAPFAVGGVIAGIALGMLRDKIRRGRRRSYGRIKGESVEENT